MFQIRRQERNHRHGPVEVLIELRKMKLSSVLSKSTAIISETSPAKKPTRMPVCLSSSIKAARSRERDFMAAIGADTFHGFLFLFIIIEEIGGQGLRDTAPFTRRRTRSAWNATFMTA